MVKLWLEDGTHLLAEEGDEIVLESGAFKKANKVTSLDTLKYMGKVYNVEKERIPGRTAVCNLASVNLSKINSTKDIQRVVPIAVNMLDNVIDLNFYPLKKVKDTNLATRAIGLGVMGEAQMLAEKQIMFGSQIHLEYIDRVMDDISYNVILSSHILAMEKGSYPEFSGSNWSKGVLPIDVANKNALALTEHTSQNDWPLLRKLSKIAMRNGYMMAIAPTSSISILVGTTQAIEPVYKRKWFEENLSGLIPVVVPNLSPDTYAFYKPAYEVDQLDIIKAAAIRQKWIDQGQSTNIFLSIAKASGKYMNQIYTLAHKLGCKSTYYLRSQSPEAVAEVADRTLECSGCQ